MAQRTRERTWRTVGTAAAVCAALSLLVISRAGAQYADTSPAETSAQLDDNARANLRAGLRGDLGRLEQGLIACRATLAETPHHAEALVWLGAANFFRSSHEMRDGDRAEGLRLMRLGLEQMHAAVAIAPDDDAVRAPRGLALLQAAQHVPFPNMKMEWLETGVNDLDHALQLQQPRFREIPAPQRGELLTALAKGWHDLGTMKAEKYLNRTIGELPDTEYAAQARKRLDALHDAP